MSSEGDGLTLMVRTFDGKQQHVQVDKESELGDLASKLVEIKLITELGSRFIAVSNGQVLRVGKGNITEQGVVNNSEVLVLPPTKDNENATKEDKHEPLTQDSIDEKTAGIPPSDDARNGMIKAPGLEALFGSRGSELFDIVGILLRISQSLQQIVITDNERQNEAFEETAMQQDEPELDPYANIDESILMNLCAIGFPENRAKKALVISNMDIEAAMEWLLSHENDPDIDKPLSPPPKPMKTNTGSTFTPDPQEYRRLIEMGFEDKDILAALQLTRNNFTAACDWLLGGEDVHAALAEREKNTMDLNSPLVQEILNDATVQACLVEPRICQALQALLEDPEKSFPAFRHDPKVRKVLHFVTELLKRRSQF